MEGTQSHRHLQPIAPATNLISNADRPVSSESPPPPKTVVSPERRSSSLQVNRQWVLPPRPKPGRKPKNVPAPKRRVGRPLSSSKQQHSNKAVDLKPIKPANPSNWEVKFDDSKSSTLSASSTTIPGNLEEDEKCTLCTREDCMCETIGLNKPITPSYSSQSKTLPSLDSILNSSSIKMDAVPLTRSSNYSGVRKFKRVESLRPLHPPLPGLSPSEGLSQHENCGFCTESSECACADTAQLQAQPQQQQQQQQRSQSLPQISVGSPQPLQHIVAYNSHPQYLSGIPQMPSPHIAAPHVVPTPTPYPFVMSPSTPQSQNISQHQLQAQPLQQVSTPNVSEVQLNDDVHSCVVCEKDAMSMLFCLSLASAHPLDQSAVSLPCHLAFKTLQKHHRFEGCDLGKLVSRLEVHNKHVGVQSINRVLQDLDKGEFTT